MTYGVAKHCDFTAHDDEHPVRSTLPQSVFGGAALAFIALACSWTVYANLAGTDHNAIVAGPTVTVVTAQPTPITVASAPTEPDLLTAPTFDVALLDASRSLGLPPGMFALNAAVRPARFLTAQAPSRTPPVRVSVPLPPSRPAGLGSPSLQATAQRGRFALASAESTPVASSAFEKIFGKTESGPTLAYAAPDGGVFNNGQSISSGRMPANDGMTAIYDISARTVYMPDGTKLEAHSGLGGKRDDPRYVHVKMLGATPPHVYDLVPREALFHGVAALRLIPADGEGAVFGRTGLLAHTYMLGPNGDSNGCVSFKDYGAFLRAYQNGKVKRLVVVASGGRSLMAASN